MSVSENRGIPKMDGLQWKTLSKWMIWGYHYFWKHPYGKGGGWFKYIARPKKMEVFFMFLLKRAVFFFGWVYFFTCFFVLA